MAATSSDARIACSSLSRRRACFKKKWVTYGKTLERGAGFANLQRDAHSLLELPIREAALQHSLHDRLQPWIYDGRLAGSAAQLCVLVDGLGCGCGGARAGISKNNVIWRRLDQPPAWDVKLRARTNEGLHKLGGLCDVEEGARPKRIGECIVQLPEMVEHLPE